MKKEEEIKQLDIMLEAFLKLLNAEDGYIKEQFKCTAFIDLKILKEDLHKMARNIKSDFMPLVGTKLNVMLHIQRERVEHYRKMMVQNNWTKDQFKIMYEDEKKKNDSLNSFLSVVLEDILEERQQELLKRFSTFNKIAVMKMKIDKGLELSPTEKEFVKQSIS
jgi:hypothetical protein